MDNNKVAGSIVTVVLMHALVRLLIRRRILRRADLEHMVARLMMQARREAGTRLATASEAGADVMRGWLVEAGDEPRGTCRPGLRVVQKDD